jgi:exodeoxyribonuclease-5
VLISGETHTLITDIIRLLKDADEFLLNDVKNFIESKSIPYTSMRCSVCSKPVFHTPSGFVCTNGHGGIEEEVPAEDLTLTNDQQNAWDKIQNWVKGDHGIFVLRGFAGTGKSFLMKMLLNLPHNFIFSAPTNKASHVLADFIGQQCKTTYSVLGLKMTAEDDQMVLKASDELPDLGNNPILVIDEAGMIPAFMTKLLTDAVANKGWRIIFVGDPAQLNPVGEERSQVWGLAHPEHRAMLKEVKRFDNQLLKLATKIRNLVKEPEGKLVIKPDNDKDEGIFVASSYEFEMGIKKNKDWGNTKIVVWRNKTANYYNKMVRKSLGYVNDYHVGERILLAGPIISDGTILGYTDEELTIVGLDERIFSYPEGAIDAHVMTVADRPFSLYIPKDPSQLATILSARASYASTQVGKARKNAWNSFWDLKGTFQSIRYGYAMTAHRLQGSTYENVYVDKADILANRNKRESYRCLYVAATRPTKKFITY